MSQSEYFSFTNAKLNGNVNLEINKNFITIMHEDGRITKWIARNIIWISQARGRKKIMISNTNSVNDCITITNAKDISLINKYFKDFIAEPGQDKKYHFIKYMFVTVFIIMIFNIFKTREMDSDIKTISQLIRFNSRVYSGDVIDDIKVCSMKIKYSSQINNIVQNIIKEFNINHVPRVKIFEDNQIYSFIDEQDVFISSTLLKLVSRNEFIIILAVEMIKLELRYYDNPQINNKKITFGINNEDIKYVDEANDINNKIKQLIATKLNQLKSSNCYLNQEIFRSKKWDLYKQINPVRRNYASLFCTNMKVIGKGNLDKFISKTDYIALQSACKK